MAEEIKSFTALVLFTFTGNILDYYLGLAGVALTFQVGNQSWGSIPEKNSNWELRNSDFWLNLEHTIKQQMGGAYVHSHIKEIP